MSHINESQRYTIEVLLKKGHKIFHNNKNLRLIFDLTLGNFFWRYVNLHFFATKMKEDQIFNILSTREF